jgi:hypothetical protein
MYCRGLSWRLLFALLCSVAAQAQQAGYLDLTNATTIPTQDWVLPPECDGRIHHFWGLGSGARENLRLEITELSSDRLGTGAELTASVRLSNLGKEAVVLPWGQEEDISFVKSLEGSQQYARAGLQLKLSTKGKSDFNLALESTATLYATPAGAWTNLTLNPGEWVEVRTRSKVACGNSEGTPCPDRKQASKVQISAEWREIEHTQTRTGCEFWQAASPRRTLTSAALPIQFASSEK